MMLLVIECGLLIIICNMFWFDYLGMWIMVECIVFGLIKGLILSLDLVVLNLEGIGLIGVLGIVECVFVVLCNVYVLVVMIL